MFRRNVGGLDRVARVTLGVLLVPVGFVLLGGLRGDAIGLIAAALGFLALATGVTGFCPLYVPLGISTARASQFPSLWSGCRSMIKAKRPACGREDIDACSCQM